MAGRNVRFGIVGLGQIGGSLMLALRRSQASLQIGGYDVDPRRLSLAQPYLDFSAENETDLFHWADVVVLATPVQTILRLLRTVGNEYPSTLFTDVGSTKREVVACARSFSGLRFVPAHPFAGSEHEGERGWNAELFAGRPYFLVPMERTREEDLDRIRKLATLVDADPVILDVETHDRVLALTSHLPLLVSAAMALLFDQSELQRHHPAIGSGIRSVTRLAGGSPVMGRDLLLTNKDEILPLLRRLNTVLVQLERSLEKGDGEAMLEWLRRAQKLYREQIAENGEEK